MKSVAERTDQTRLLIEKLLKVSPDASVTANAERMLRRVKLPMTVVLDKVPGDTLVEKAKKLGVTRQTLFYWRRGMTRPDRKMAKLLASLTGFDANEIGAREE